MEYKLSRPGGSVMVVGCGGTGAFVAEGLCRLLPDRRLILVDHDRVEERNIGRQNFFREDLGKFKAQVLAERLARQFDREVEFSTSPVEELGMNWRGSITIGCVDNPAARERLQYCRNEQHFFYNTLKPKSYQCFGGWYIDAGNGDYYGQVLIGNSFLYELQKGFVPNRGICFRLPLPTIQQPSLLAPAIVLHNDCAEAVEREEQSPVINRMMADLVLTFVHKLVKGKLSWMAAYIDLESGSLRTVDATPEVVSRLTGHTQRQLEYHPRPVKVRKPRSGEGVT